jgi:hypothetical protein
VGSIRFWKTVSQPRRPGKLPGHRTSSTSSSDCGGCQVAVRAVLHVGEYGAAFSDSQLFGSNRATIGRLVPDQPPFAEGEATAMSLLTTTRKSGDRPARSSPNGRDGEAVRRGWSWPMDSGFYTSDIVAAASSWRSLSGPSSRPRGFDGPGGPHWRCRPGPGEPGLHRRRAEPEAEIRSEASGAHDGSGCDSSMQRRSRTRWRLVG